MVKCDFRVFVAKDMYVFGKTNLDSVTFWRKTNGLVCDLLLQRLTNKINCVM